LLGVVLCGTVQSLKKSLADGTTWSEWLDLGGYSERNPAIAENLDGTLSLFVVGAGGTVYTQRQYNPYREECVEREVTATGRTRTVKSSPSATTPNPGPPIGG
jgi:phage terminase large subunit-like protein